MTHFSAWLVGAVATTCVVGASFAGEKISLNDAPAAAVKAVKDKFPNAELRDRVEKDTKAGVVYYEFELLRDGKKIDADVYADGRFREIEIELDPSALPKPVADAIAARFPAGKVTKAKEDIEFPGGQETKHYDIDVLVAGDTLDVKVDPSGKILKVDD